MAKLWDGKASIALDKIAEDFNSSIKIDSAMYKQDIKASVAHSNMLYECGLLSKEESVKLNDTLLAILDEIESHNLEIDLDCEDIHSFIEQELTKRLGSLGKKIHTARSRNDQVATDLKLYLKDEVKEIIALIKALIKAIIKQAEENLDSLMPGYTHLQRAQPITFAHHILAYAMMLERDISRLNDAVKRMNVSPLGSCALAGTTYDINRDLTAITLGFDSYSLNSIDGVSDRDFCVELCSNFSLLMCHLSRFSEEIILWTSWEFKFVELSEAYTTGSSIMPQKKNSDMAELVRGKTGRVYGNLIATLTMLKGLALAYNKDMQEDKEAIFDSIKTVKDCLNVFIPMVYTMKTKSENMIKAAKEGFIDATDLADYLTKKGLAFRDSYKLVGQIVNYASKNNLTLSEIDLNTYKNFSSLFEDDLYEEVSLLNCVNKRISKGGTAKESVLKQIEYMKEVIK